MAQYYFVIDGKQSGPHSVYDIKNLVIKPDTLTWCEGMDNWAEAASIDEIAAQLQAKEDHAANVETAGANLPVPGECPQPHLGLAIFSAIMFPAGIAAIVKTVLIKVRWKQGRYDDARWLAETAKKYIKLSIIIGAVIWGLYFIYLTILMLAVFANI